MKLLYRGNKKNDEFIFDYIARIGRGNGYTNTKKFFKLISKYVENDEVFRYSDLNKKAESRLAMEQILRRNIPLDESRRYTHAKRYIWSKVPGACEKCLALSSYTRFYWWLSSYRICHVHGELISREYLAGNEVVGTDSVLLSKDLCESIISFYEKSESIQRSVLDEIERFHLDQSIVNTLVFHFSECGISADSASSLRDAIWDKNLIGFSASDRIQNIAKLFSVYMGTEKFWLRMIALTKKSYQNQSLAIKGHWFGVESEYSRYFSYVMGTDTKFIEVFTRVAEFKYRKEMDDISIKGILDGSHNVSDVMIYNIKMSIFSLRGIKSWVSECQSFDDIFKKRSPHEVFKGGLNRFV